MGSKLQRQNQHIKRLESKIRRWKKKDKNTEGLEKELGYCMGEDRPVFRTGSAANPPKRRGFAK